jgi:hypothetical protein
MTNRFKLPLILLLVCLSGCESIGNGHTDRLIGQWQSSVGGFSIVIEYGKEFVMVDNNDPVPYRLKGDRLTIMGEEDLVRVVSFPGKDMMVQSDPLTGTSQEFSRLSR